MNPLAPPAGAFMGIVRRRYNRTAQILQRVETSDGQGGTAVTWAVYATVDGAFQTLSGIEAQRQGTAEQVADFNWLMDFRNDFDPTMRLQLGTRLFEITDVTDLAEQGMLLQLGLKERFAK